MINRERTQGTQKEIGMDTTEVMRLCDQVRETAYAIHQYHGNGYCLQHSLRSLPSFAVK